MVPNLDAWLACFERRAAHPPALPTGLEDRLPEDERARIARSIATFQLGEQSEGHTLRSLAQRHADRHGCPELVRITECFIREEQRHAATLAAYMAAHGISRRTHAWSDTVFRGLRRRLDFELAVTVLVTAELMGIQFYRALLRSSRSRRLQGLCSLFLQDEALHVAYESELLRAMRDGRGRTLALAAALLHGAFHVATAAVVWLEHRRVFRAAGYTAWGFLVLCARHYALYLMPPPRGRAVTRSTTANR